MAWTSPKTWTSEPLTSLDLNTHLRDNQNHLKGRMDNRSSVIASGASSYRTTSTSFVDIDATHLSLTVNTHGADVLLGFTGAVHNKNNASSTYFNVAVDSVDYFDDDGITQLTSATSGDQYRLKPICFVVLITGLNAGSHNFKLRWKTYQNNTSTLEIVRLHPQFWVQEL